MRSYIILFYAALLHVYRKPFLYSTTTLKILYLPGIAKLRQYNALALAYWQYKRARKKIPAFDAFLKSKDFGKISFTGMRPNLHEIPYTDKENYVKKYSMDERCNNGKLPDKEVIIDESSGSSGTATNWARGKTEREKNAKVIRFSIENLIGKEPVFIINAFALGPWATGVNVTMNCVKFSKLKSLGPDKVKIENTLKQFGPNHRYIIMGYPPFLKSLVDTTSIPWNDYNITLIMGGESMSEGMRSYLLNKGIKKIYSSLGASDLELNLAGENDFTIQLRKLLHENETLRKKVMRFTGAIPMVFQYNPTDFFIESSDKGELIVTISRSGYIAPKIRYNIHDRGHVMELNHFYRLLEELGIDKKIIGKPMVDLPLLFHYGRADMTVSFFGANISPVDIQEVLYTMPELNAKINSFYLNATEDANSNKQLNIILELYDQVKTADMNIDKINQDFFNGLAKINQDFREAYKMTTPETTPKLLLQAYATGHFKNNDVRIKANYISTK